MNHKSWAMTDLLCEILGRNRNASCPEQCFERMSLCQMLKCYHLELGERHKVKPPFDPVNLDKELLVEILKMQN